MKVLMFFYDLSRPAGIQRVLATLSNALVAAGVEVHVLVTSNDASSFFPLSSSIPVSTLRLPEPEGGSRGWLWLRKAWWARRAAARVRRYVRAHGITHVVDHGTGLGLLYPRATIGAASFVLFRHFPARAFPGGRLLYRLLRWFKARSHVVVLTPSIQAEFRALGYGDVEVISNPVARPPPLAQRARSRYVLAVGRDSPQKGMDLLVRAFALLSPRQPGVRLRIIGPGIDQSPSLNHLVRQLQLEHAVDLEGPRSSLLDVVHEAAVVVLPSRYEALPMFLLETLAQGAPVVATDVDGNRDFVRDHVNGLLVPPESPEGLARGVEELLQNPALADSLASAAPETVAGLTPDRVAGKWIQYLHALGA